MKFFVLLFTLLFTLLAGDIDPKTFTSIKMLDKPHITIKKAYDHGSVYELSIEINSPRGKESTTVYVSKNKKAVFLGEALDADTGENIRRPLNMAEIRKSADIIYGTGEKELVVFTDPECPYCVKFEKMWPELQNKVTIYVYFTPLSHHRNATQMSYHVMKQKDHESKAKALLAMAHGDKSYEQLTMTQQISDLFSKKIQENQMRADQFGVRGTPAVFDAKGIPVNWMRLLR